MLMAAQPCEQTKNFIVCELQLNFFVKWGEHLGRLEVLWRWMIVMVEQQYECT